CRRVLFRSVLPVARARSAVPALELSRHDALLLVVVFVLVPPAPEELDLDDPLVLLARDTKPQHACHARRHRDGHVAGGPFVGGACFGRADSKSFLFFQRERLEWQADPPSAQSAAELAEADTARSQDGRGVVGMS